MPRPLNYIGNEGTYGRVTGLGTVPCSQVVVPAGFVGPIDCDPTDGPANYPASQSQVANLWDYISGTTTSDTTAPNPTIGSLIQQNLPWLLGGVLIALVLRSGR